MALSSLGRLSIVLPVKTSSGVDHASHCVLGSSTVVYLVLTFCFLGFIMIAAQTTRQDAPDKVSHRLDGLVSPLMTVGSRNTGALQNLLRLDASTNPPVLHSRSCKVKYCTIVLFLSDLVR